MSTPQEIIEGQFVTWLPYFNGQQYSWWKNWMKNYIQADDYELWMLIKNWSPYSKKGNQKWELGS